MFKNFQELQPLSKAENSGTLLLLPLQFQSSEEKGWVLKPGTTMAPFLPYDRYLTDWLIMQMLVLHFRATSIHKQMLHSLCQLRQWRQVSLAS